MQPFLDEVGARMMQPDSKEVSGMNNPLALHPLALPLLPTPRTTFLSECARRTCQTATVLTN